MSSKGNKRRKKPTGQWDIMKSIRKPAVPRTQVHPDKKYDRKDKSWMNDLEDDR